METQPPKQPLGRLQAFLVQLKEVIKLFREVLLEVKELLVVVTIILFFILGVWDTLKPKVEPLFQNVSALGSP